MVDGILLALAAACTVYFVIIVVYAGIGTSFAFIWLFFAALLVFLVYGKWYYSRNMIRIPGWVPVSIVTTCVSSGAGTGLCHRPGGQSKGAYHQRFPEKEAGSCH